MASSSSPSVSDMEWLSNVYDPKVHNFVDQQVPRELAAVMRLQTEPLLTKPEIANDPNHAHCAKAASQLTDESSVWLVVAQSFRVLAAAQGYEDFPLLQHDPFEMSTMTTAGKI